ncbi:hypothetical protein PAXRUDRAFT_608391 [Paxillus rubicundulus Ve08.2h10]|uniref:Uncharacterized protein n=1 Tax=Paxillus rubicundulus Ve08.2h10 TaxID=930991 RepID=A0A0D0DTH7_9AGAM|nr:hypothetical protein PAXRUDRAFT_608391 [Paxillus rubicundulus Ve08.2h10]
MSLFEWSTSERRAGNRDLSITPNKICLIIFEHIAPASTGLSSKQILTLSNLSPISRSLLPIYVSPHFGTAHMKNVRKFKFICSSVTKAHWDVVTTLESLEELTSMLDFFFGGPADMEPGKRLQVKVSSLLVYGCESCSQPSAAIDAHHFRTLAVDLDFADQVNWLSETALTKLRVPDLSMAMASHVRLGRILRQIPQAIQVLRLPIATDTFSDMDKLLFGDPTWEKMPLLETAEAPRQTINLFALINARCINDSTTGTASLKYTWPGMPKCFRAGSTDITMRYGCCIVVVPSDDQMPITTIDRNQESCHERLVNSWRSPLSTAFAKRLSSI